VASAAPAAPGESSAAGSDADTAKQAAAGAAAAGAMVGAMIGGGKKSVTTVDFQALKAVLPESAGDLKRTSAEGERTSTGGFSVSTAKGVYTDGHGGNVDVEIHDMANASGLLSMMGLATAVESESDTGYEKNEMIDGLKVHEKWTKADQSSELLAQVADRFMIEVRGNRVPIDTAKAALVGVDRAKLASLH
ncbi:MAG: hypothetical protein ACREM6_00055, partial [Vulcanimicrobiaceae bacterium]